MQAAELQASIEGHQATLGALERTAAALEGLQGERNGLAADLAAASEALSAARQQLGEARAQLQQQAQEAAAHAEGLAKVWPARECHQRPWLVAVLDLRDLLSTKDHTTMCCRAAARLLEGRHQGLEVTAHA